MAKYLVADKQDGTGHFSGLWAKLVEADSAAEAMEEFTPFSSCEVEVWQPVLTGYVAVSKPKRKFTID